MFSKYMDPPYARQLGELPSVTLGGRTTVDGVTMAGTLADTLRELSDEQLAQLLCARPDVLSPVPATFDELASRLSSRASLARALDDLDRAALAVVEAAVVAEWDGEIERLVAEAVAERSDRIVVPLPSSLSATSLSRLQEDPEEFARDLARPMPRPPSPAARFGTRFHTWLEARFDQVGLFDPDELAGRADAGIADEDDLRELIAVFEAGPFGSRTPYAVEAPFAQVLAGQVVRGRIDAVYRDDDGRFLVVDWKTNRAATADPLQLGLYRQAWAELAGVGPEQVRAAFYYVRTGELREYDELPGRTTLEALLVGEGSSLGV
jgi:DNA helicase-2/ATP-dependent DNA helicase PcrA